MAFSLFCILVNVFPMFLISLLAFWLVGRGFCRFRRVLAAALIQSVLVTLLAFLGAVLEEAAAMIACFAALFCVLTAPYFLSRYLLRLPRSRAFIASVLFLLLVLILGSIGYGCC